MTATDTTSEAIPSTTRGAWHGPIVIEGRHTGDGRRIREDGLVSRALPLPIMLQRETPSGVGNPHAGARIAGRMDYIYRHPDNPAEVWAAGVYDVGEDGVEAERLVGNRMLKGISVDLDDVTGEILDDGTAEYTSGRVMGATIVPFPAIPGAEITNLSDGEFAAIADFAAAFATAEEEPHEYEDSGDGTCAICGKPQAGHGDGMVAAGGPLMPPESWFTDPGLDRLTPLTITDDGRVYGHAFGWEQTHTALAGRRAPRNFTGFKFFRLGSTRAECDCGDGSWAEIATGPITIGTSHADTRLDARAAVAHYENTGLAMASVVCGEDRFGTWIAGALRPGVAEERLVELRGATLSPDWRWRDGRLELMALLAVNMPGFPIPRTSFHTHDGEEMALVASGIVPPEQAAFTAGTVDGLARRLARLEAYLEPAMAAEQAARLGITPEG